MHDPNQLAMSLPGYVTAMRSQSRRRYADPWDDWPNQNTGRPNPVVYALWADSHTDGVLYIGQTVDLGKRLAEHDAATGWGTKFEYVTYIDLPEFGDPALRLLDEHFLITVFDPPENDKSR